MATAAALPTFDITTGRQYVLFKGAIALGQVVNFSPRITSSQSRVPRIGDSNKKVVSDVAENQLSIELYTQKSLKEVALLMGTTIPVGGSGPWDGTTTITLNPDVPAFDMVVKVYTTPDSGSNALVQTWTMTNFKPSSLSFQVSADSPALTCSIEGSFEGFSILVASGTVL
jgi:hypothetical protein